MPLDQSTFDWKHPDYAPIFEERVRRLKWLRADTKRIDAIKAYYSHHENTAKFINDWGMTFDPRSLADPDTPATIPFILFPKQVAFIDETIATFLAKDSLIVEKSREMGISWCAVAVACKLCIFNRGMVVGFGSRVEDLVDRLGDPDTLFEKARMFMDHLPVEFRGGWRRSKHAPHMRILFPNTGSIMVGKAGNDIGRGGRTTLFFFDEAAHHPQADQVEFSLSQNTRTRIDLSSVKGRNNPFARKRWDGKHKVFTFHWRDDPRKDDAWYQKELERLGPVVVAQEIDINYDASVEGILIPQTWVQAAVDAHIKLGWHPSGQRSASLDVADQGEDKLAWIGVHGNVLEGVSQWSGQGSDMGYSTQKAFSLNDAHGYTLLHYDGDGIGGGIAATSRMVNDQRPHGQRIEVEPFHGSGAVLDPERSDLDDGNPGIPTGKKRKNKDFFQNRKAQAWWALRDRFYKTWKCTEAKGKGEPPPYKFDELISIPTGMPLRDQLCQEISQPVVKWSTTGKMVIDKLADGQASPNLGDALMMRMHSTRRTSWVTAGLLAATGAGRV